MSKEVAAGRSRATVRIIVIDDHEVVREGLRATLSSDPRFEVVGAGASGGEALALVRRTLPDVAIVDLRLPDMPGDELCRRLRATFPQMAIVLLTTYLSEEAVRNSLSAGATAYVTKAAGIAALRDVLAQVMADGPTGPGPSGATQIVNQLHGLVARRMEGLRTTPQQERVLELAAQGLTNQQIGDRLYITESTVRFHLQKLKNTLNARTRTELIAKAIRVGVIAPGAEAGSPTR